jgi:hypothetical protein
MAFSDSLSEPPPDDEDDEDLPPDEDSEELSMDESDDDDDFMPPDNLDSDDGDSDAPPPGDEDDDPADSSDNDDIGMGSLSIGLALPGAKPKSILVSGATRDSARKSSRVVSIEDEKETGTRKSEVRLPNEEEHNGNGGESETAPNTAPSDRKYTVMRGRYEDDDFEPLGVMLVPEESILSVHIIEAEERVPVIISLNLGESSVALDPSDPNAIFLRTVDHTITFKASDPADIHAIVSELPKGVLSEELSYITGKVVPEAGGPPSAPPPVSTLGAGTGFMPPEETPSKPKAPASLSTVKGYNRLELVETHIKKTQPSLPRGRLLCMWINSLHIWPSEVTILNLHSSICNGMLLADLVKKLIPSTQYMHLNKKALARVPALENLDQALGAIWRSKCVNSHRIPSAVEIYDGNNLKIFAMLQELFEVYVQRPLMKTAVRTLKWYTNILKQYKRALPSTIFTECEFSALWPHFQSGTALFCLIYHVYGPVEVGSGETTTKIDPLRIVSEPSNISEYRSNVLYLFNILKALKIECLWNVNDWLNFGESDFTLLQLQLIYDALKTRQCSLPPAQGRNAGVTSGPKGEPMVVGIVFADTNATAQAVDARLKSSGVSQVAVKKNRSCLLGSANDALAFIPIDTRYKRAHDLNAIPAGLLAHGVKVMYTPINLKSARPRHKDRARWDGTHTLSEDSARHYGRQQVRMLKNTNQSSSRTQKQTVVADVQFRKTTSKETVDIAAGVSQKLSVITSESIDGAIRDLEEATAIERRTLDDSEDELAERYTNLEKMVEDNAITSMGYEKAFTDLENDRILLEERRTKLTEIYNLKIESIRSQNEEAKKREAAATDAAQKKTPAKSPLNRSTRGSPTKGRKPETPKDTTKMEKQWVTHHHKSDTHNMVIKSISDKQTKKLHESWQSPLEKKIPAKQLPIEEERPVDVVWREFLKKLNDANERWYQGKGEQTSMLQTLMQTKITDPMKVPTDMAGLDSSAWVSHPGDYETDCMAYEDAYRRRVVLEKSHRITHANTSISQRKADNSFSSSSPFQQEGVSGPETSIAAKWLTAGRSITLLDRATQQEYYWGAEKDARGNFNLSWREAIGTAVEGFVPLRNVRDMQQGQDKSTLSVRVDEVPSVLQSTRGRTVLKLKCASVPECEKLLSSLAVLIQASVYD